MNRDILKMVFTLTLVCVISGASLSFFFDKTKDAIAEAKRQKVLKAIKSVLPPIDNEPDKDAVEIVSGKDKKGNDTKTIFYKGKKGDSLVGIVFKTSSPEGYSGAIEVMVGVDPNGTVTAIEIVSHAETPGLGDKISKDWFKAQYKGKNLGNANWLVKKDGGDFDQITGATISPRAVTKAVKSGLEFFAAHREEILG